MALKIILKFCIGFKSTDLVDLFDVASFTLLEDSELSLDQPNNACCNMSALTTQCGDKKSVSWGDESGT